MRWEGKKHWGAGVPRHRTSISNWLQPLSWNRKAAKDGLPHRTFCASLADVFDNEVPDEWRRDLWELIDKTPNLQWLLVTKRIGNAAKMFPWNSGISRNVRLLITVCNQEEADRDIPKLLALPCKNGISYEPALGPVVWSPWMRVNPLFKSSRGIEWIIVGGESGSKARPFDLAWAHSTIVQCKAAGVPVFVKQLGSRPYDSLAAWKMAGCREHPWPEKQGAMRLKDRAGADPSEWPEDLRVREFPQ